MNTSSSNSKVLLNVSSAQQTTADKNNATPQPSEAQIRASIKIQRFYRFRKLRKKLFKQGKKRVKIIKELIETEETYVGNLEIVDRIRLPLTKKKIIDDKDISKIFGNISTIIPLNKALLQNLKSSQPQEEQNPSLKSVEDFLQFSTPYEPRRNSQPLSKRGSMSFLTSPFNNKRKSEEYITQDKRKSIALPKLDFRTMNVSSTKKSGFNWNLFSQKIRTTITGTKRDHSPSRKSSTPPTQPSSPLASSPIMSSSPPSTPKSEPKKTKKLSVGETFMKFTPFLKLYTTYLNNYTEAAECLKKCRLESPKLAEYLTKWKQRPECKGLSLEHFLITPVQRIPRYKMLLYELLMNTPKEHHDYAALKKACDLVESVANHLNEQRKQKDSQGILKKLKQIFATDIVQPHRHIVRDGTLLVSLDNGSNWIQCDCYLFNDLMLIISKETEKNFSLQLMLHLLFCFADTIPDNSKQFEISFIVTKQKFIFDCSQEIHCQEWYNDIRNHKRDEKNKLEQVGSLHRRVSKVELESVIARKKALRKEILHTKNEYLKLQKQYAQNQDVSQTSKFKAELKSLAEQLIKKCEEMEQKDKILLHCLRQDKKSLYQYFGENPSIDNLNLEEFLNDEFIETTKESKSETKDVENDELKKQKEINQQLQQALDKLTTQYNQVVKERDEQKNRADDLYVQLENRKELYENVCKERNKLNKDLQKLNKEFIEYRIKHDGKDKEAKNELTKLHSTEMEDMKKRYEAQINNLQKQLEEMRIRYNTLYQEKEKLVNAHRMNKKMDELKKVHDLKFKKMDETKKSNDSKFKKIGELKKVIDPKFNKTDELKKVHDSNIKKTDETKKSNEFSFRRLKDQFERSTTNHNHSM